MKNLVNMLFENSFEMSAKQVKITEPKKSATPKSKSSKTPIRKTPAPTTAVVAKKSATPKSKAAIDSGRNSVDVDLLPMDKLEIEDVLPKKSARSTGGRATPKPKPVEDEGKCEICGGQYCGKDIE